MKYIYKMSWYDSKRHTKSHTNMYYLQEHHTRWGHENELCRISVVEVEETSNEYDSAVNNDKVATEEEEKKEIEKLKQKNKVLKEKCRKYQEELTSFRDWDCENCSDYEGCNWSDLSED